MIQNQMENIKNKLLRHSFQQERDDQQQIAQLQSDLNYNEGNEENHVQQIITLEGDKEFTIQHVPVENNPISLSKRLSLKFTSPPQDNSNALTELSTPLNQQNGDEVKQEQKYGKTFDAIVKALSTQKNQEVNDIEQQEEQKVNNQSEEQSSQDQNNNPPNLALILQNLNMENISQENRLELVNKSQSEMLDYLQKHTQSEYDNYLNELNGALWPNLLAKLRYYQKSVVTLLVFKAAFVLTIIYYTFREFSLGMVGAKLILMYIAKNIGELYLINRQLNIAIQKIYDYDSLKYKLTEQQKSFQYHIDNIKMNQNLILQQIAQQTQEMPQLITQSKSQMDEVNNFVQQMQYDENYKRKQQEITQLKESVFSFQKNFQPYEEFILQPQKQSIARISQAILRQSQQVLFLYYLNNIFITALTILNCIMLFSDSSDQLSEIFYIILWMSLIQDHIQIFGLAFLILFLTALFIFYFIFSRTSMLIKRYKHYQKLKLRLSSLKQSKYVKSDDPNVQKECCICLSEYENDETVITLVCDSKHVFHQGCIETWVKQKDECPLCRAPIFN